MTHFGILCPAATAHAGGVMRAADIIELSKLVSAVLIKKAQAFLPEPLRTSN